jgi:hypothetical protein
MRLCLLLAALAALAGCPCGAYSGAGDRVYQQSSAMLILCANDGFVVRNADGSMVEGTYVQSHEAGTATTGATGQLAFDYTIASDGSLTAPQLAAAAWSAVSLDKTALDHADVLCTDLEMRTWWPATTTAK